MRTFHGAINRNPVFLQNNNKLRVLVAHDTLCGLSSLQNVPSSYKSFVTSEAENLTAPHYPLQLRFYLRDEPSPDVYGSWKSVRDWIFTDTSILSPYKGCVATTNDTGTHIADFVEQCSPSELMVDPYFIVANIPHPSLENSPELSTRAGIHTWDYEFYRWNLQQCIDAAIRNYVQPAAEAAHKYGIRLIFVPQLHGVLRKMYDKYGTGDPDNESVLRPPSPSEIRLQYNLGIAYGAKGFVAFPYGPDTTLLSHMKEDYPGLVSRNSSLLDHSRNKDIIFGADSVWTGYKEKWDEFARINKRLQIQNNVALGDTLNQMTWIGAKSWTTKTDWHANTPFENITNQTSHWINIVTSVKTVVPYAFGKNQFDSLYHFVEVGHLQNTRLTDYIVVVNRRCAQTDTATITVTLKSGFVWKVVDIENPSHTWIIIGGQSFRDTFEPGGGKIYRLE